MPGLTQRALSQSNEIFKQVAEMPASDISGHTNFKIVVFQIYFIFFLPKVIVQREIKVPTEHAQE